jgi:ribosomal protein S18 acetylase RimI-like enzyme
MGAFMIIIDSTENKFIEDFLPLIMYLWGGDMFSIYSHQHSDWLSRKLHVAFIDFGTALCAYTDNGEPMGYILYKHDTGLEGVDFTGKHAHIIHLGLHSQYRKQGACTKLLNEAIRKIKEQKGECIYAEVYAKDEETIIYYVKRGFIPIAYHLGENGKKDNGQIYLYREI